MFDIIGIDWGHARCGIAFGSSQTKLVIAGNSDNNTADIFDILATEITKRKPTKIVIGLPTNFNFQPTEVTTKVMDFVVIIKKFYPQLSVSTFNERNSTKDTKAMLLSKNSLLKNSPAQKSKVDKHAINNQSAANILTRYLEKNK